ncbi:MAG: energy transducer TonB [Deltaproteobacteria bacterium]|jgi:protein TonB|nr:energy transducer TonB [Deltaproteobacteria bacterium]
MNASRKSSDHVFSRALILAIAFHLTIILYLIAPRPDPGFQVLASMEFDTYDPLGGQPGGDQAEAIPDADPNAQPVEPPDPVEEPEPIEEEPDVVEDPPQVIESTSEKAEDVAPPPPPKEPPKEPPKPKPKPKPRPKPEPQAKPPGNPNAEPGTGQPGATGLGGGPGTGQGGVGGGTGKGNPNAFAAYKTKVQRKLERYKKYPPAARNSKTEGTVTVRFTINRTGKVIQSQLVKSSGSPILDDEVMALLRRVDPFPEFPKEIPDNTITLTAPIRFSIRDR